MSDITYAQYTIADAARLVRRSRNKTIFVSLSAALMANDTEGYNIGGVAEITKRAAASVFDQWKRFDERKPEELTIKLGISDNCIFIG